MSQMGQLMSKDAQQIVLPQQCKLLLPEKTTGFHFSIPTDEPKDSLPKTTGFSFSIPTSESKSSPPTFTQQTTEAPAPSAFTPQTTEAPTRLTEAQQLKFAQMTICTLTSKNEQLENENRNLIRKTQSKDTAVATRRTRRREDMLRYQVVRLTSNEDDAHDLYDRLLRNSCLARQLLRVDLCTHRENCSYGDSCHFAHNEQQQQYARSNWDCPIEGCTGIDRVTRGKCMWKHPEKTASENTDE